MALGGTGAAPPRLSPALALAGKRADALAAGLPEPAVERLLLLRAAGEPERELARIARAGARLLFPEDAAFPRDLAQHPACPPVLYARGGPIPDGPRAAIVGARACSPALARFAERLGRACASAGVPVVSGLARGIDAAAHRGVLAGNGAAVAVLGTGVDVAYPRETRELHARVAECGVLLSTYALGSEPRPFHFPLRNRIVAALAATLVVVQATEDSGTMSTAKAALDGNTDVCAVPGSPDDPLARGTNRLLRDGARPILEPADLLDPLVGVGVCPREPLSSGKAPTCGPPGRDRLIRMQITSTPLAPEEIAHATRLPLCEVVERLVGLELEGSVERLPGRLFRCRGDGASLPKSERP